MSEQRPVVDPVALRFRLAESEVADLSGFDNEVIDDIVAAVASWAAYAESEPDCEDALSGDPEFDAAWDEECNEPADRNRQAKAILNAINKLRSALNESDAAYKGVLATIYRSIAADENTSSARSEAQPGILQSFDVELERLARATERTKGRRGAKVDADAQAIREVAYAIKAFGERQEPEQYENEDGTTQEYPPLQKTEHRVEVIREVLEIAGLPSDLDAKTLARYSRLGPKCLKYGRG